MSITSITDFDYVNTLPEPTPFAPSAETINPDIERSTYLSGNMKNICGLRQTVLGLTDLTEFIRHKNRFKGESQAITSIQNDNDQEEADLVLELEQESEKQSEYSKNLLEQSLKDFQLCLGSLRDDKKHLIYSYLINDRNDDFYPRVLQVALIDNYEGISYGKKELFEFLTSLDVSSESVDKYLDINGGEFLASFVEWYSSKVALEEANNNGESLLYNPVFPIIVDEKTKADHPKAFRKDKYISNYFYQSRDIKDRNGIQLFEHDYFAEVAACKTKNDYDLINALLGRGVNDPQNNFDEEHTGLDGYGSYVASVLANEFQKANKEVINALLVAANRKGSVFASDLMGKLQNETCAQYLRSNLDPSVVKDKLSGLKIAFDFKRKSPARISFDNDPENEIDQKRIFFNFFSSTYWSDKRNEFGLCLDDSNFFHECVHLLSAKQINQNQRYVRYGLAIYFFDTDKSPESAVKNLGKQTQYFVGLDEALTQIAAYDLYNGYDSSKAIDNPRLYKTYVSPIKFAKEIFDGCTGSRILEQRRTELNVTEEEYSPLSFAMDAYFSADPKLAGNFYKMIVEMYGARAPLIYKSANLNMGFSDTYRRNS